MPIILQARFLYEMSHLMHPTQCMLVVHREQFH